MLIASFEGIRSERQLIETLNLTLALRGYTGYALGEKIPDHTGVPSKVIV
jgi:hypothetical protein